MYKINKRWVQGALDETSVTIDPNVLKKFEALRSKAEVAKAQPEDKRALRDLVASQPDLWQAMGDLASVARRSVIDGSYPLAAQFAIEIEIEAIKKEYDYESAPRLDKMLIDQIIISWLQVQKTLVNYEIFMGENYVSHEAELWGLALNRANERYLRAFEALFRIRKLRGVQDPAEGHPIIDAKLGKSALVEKKKPKALQS